MFKKKLLLRLFFIISTPLAPIIFWSLISNSRMSAQDMNSGVCFIELEDGTVMDLSDICGQQQDSGVPELLDDYSNYEEVLRYYGMEELAANGNPFILSSEEISRIEEARPIPSELIADPEELSRQKTAVRDAIRERMSELCPGGVCPPGIDIDREIQELDVCRSGDIPCVRPQRSVGRVLE